MSKTELTYQVSFNTPAFLGNAEQQAQWRTPPFKALLRQWWRVVKAADVGYDHHELLKRENELFGTAWDKEHPKLGKSKVQLRLSGWNEGNLAKVDSGHPITHPEVKARPGANLYLGYGPIGGTVARNAIDPKASPLELKLRIPNKYEKEIRSALQLAHWFGSIGARSRNGFGAIHFEGDGILLAKDLRFETLADYGILKSVDECLKHEWSHAIGLDKADAPTIWRLLKLENKELDGFTRWEDVMFQLAQIKVAVRTSEFFKFEGGGKDGHVKPQFRHILSYPSGNNHSVGAWGKDGRLANQVRFKIHRRIDGKFMAVIVHLPCALPKKMATAGTPDQSKVWSEVHRLLDAQKSNGLIRLAGAST